MKSSLRFLTDGIVTPLPTASATITRTFKAVRPLRFVRRLEIGLSGEIRATIVPPATEHPNSACFVEQTEVFPDRTPKRAVKPSIVMHDRDTKFTAQAATGSARISILEMTTTKETKYTKRSGLPVLLKWTRATVLLIANAGAITRSKCFFRLFRPFRA